jgi:DNA-binding CsgD family transcriptional regulator
MKLYGLSEREREIHALLQGGRTKEQIAEELHISMATLDTYIENINSKLYGRKS